MARRKISAVGVGLRLVFWPLRLLLLVAVCLVVRFSAGPVSVPIPEAALDALMTRAAPGWRVQSSGAEFDLLGKDGLTGLKLRDVVLTDDAGNKATPIPELGLSLALSPSTDAAEAVEVRGVRIAGARLDLTREPDGSFAFGLGGLTTAGSGDEPFSLDDLFGPDGVSTLPTISLSDVRVAYRDVQRDVTVTAHGSTVTFDPIGTVTLGGTLDAGKGLPIPLDLTAARAPDGTLNIDARFAHVDPSVIAVIDPILAPLADLRMVLSGTARATVTPEGRLAALTADIVAPDGGQVVIDGKVRALQKLSVALAYSPDALHADIREIAIDDAGLSISGRAIVQRDSQDRWSITAQAPGIRFTDPASDTSIGAGQTALVARLEGGRLTVDEFKTTSPVIRVPREKLVASFASLALSGMVDVDDGRIALASVMASGIEGDLDGSPLKLRYLSGSLHGEGDAASLRKGDVSGVVWTTMAETPALFFTDKASGTSLTAGQTTLAARLANGRLAINDLRVAAPAIRLPRQKTIAKLASLAASGTVDPNAGRIDLARMTLNGIDANRDGTPLRIEGLTGSLRGEGMAALGKGRFGGGVWTVAAKAPALSYTDPASSATISTGSTTLAARFAGGRLTLDDLKTTAPMIHLPREKVIATVASLAISGRIDPANEHVDVTTVMVRDIDATVDGAPIRINTASGSLRIDGDIASIHGVRLDGVAVQSTDIGVDLATLMAKGQVNLVNGFATVDSLSLSSLRAALPEGNSVAVESLTATAQLDTRSGWARVSGLNVPRAQLGLPKFYDAPLVLDSIDFDLDRNGASFAIPRFTARVDGLPVTLMGAVNRVGETMRARIDLTTGSTPFERIPRLWPKGVAPGGFRWVSKNVRAGNVSGVALKAQIDTGNPDDDALALTFDFTDAVATAVRGLPPIQRARGRGQVTLDRLDLYLDEGHVAVPQTPGFALGESRFSIPDFKPRIPEGQIALDVSGPVQSVLHFLDHEPLGLISKSGLDIATASGDMTGTVQVKLPLSAKLDVEDVDFRANADIRDFALLDPHTGMEISGDTMAIAVKPDGLKFRSDARVDGLSARLEYEQAFIKPAPGEPEGVLTLQSYLTREDFAERAGVDVSNHFDGVAVVDAKVDLFSGGGARFAANADLSGSTLKIDRLGWTKTDGVPVTVAIEGFRNPNGAGQVEKIALRGAGMSAIGRVGFDAGGAVRLIEFDRIVLADLMDAGISYRQGTDDGNRRIEVAGAYLDLRRAFSDAMDANAKDEIAPPAGQGAITEIATRLAQVKLRDDLDITDLDGGLRLQGERVNAAKVDGRLNGTAPAQLLAERREDGLAIRLTSPDAGAFLGAASVFEGATGGQLRLDARTRDSVLPTRIAGVARVDGITIRNSQTMREILSGGAIGSLTQQMLSGGGLSFTKVELPFSGIAGRWSIQNGVAWGNALGLTLDGTYDIESKGIDLAGTISPAYAINGALGSVPLLGTFLTGGEGEGVFGVTYAVQGTTENPNVWVNPLSAIAPGFLRKIVSGVMDGRGVARADPLRRPSIAGADR